MSNSSAALAAERGRTPFGLRLAHALRLAVKTMTLGKALLFRHGGIGRRRTGTLVARHGSRFLIGLLPCLCANLRAEEAPRIGKITIRALNVFSPEEASSGWVYEAANSLRGKTRESVIRRFLLFHEGDELEPARLAETERNLRALAFVKLASVTAGAPRNGIVDVEVVTQDAWTLELGLSFGGKGGATTYGFDVQEKDFAGTGRKLGFAYASGSERTNRFFSFRDPFLFGPYWSGEVLYGVHSDGREQRVRISRPFSSLSDRWAMDAGVERLGETGRTLRNGRTASQYRRTHREISGKYGWALRAGEDGARRLWMGFDVVDDEFRHQGLRPANPLPEDRRFRYLFAEYEAIRNDYLKWNYVNRDLRYEDFNLGPQVSVRLGVSAAAFGAPRTTELLQITAAKGWRLDRDSFVSAAFGFDTRLDGGFRNETVSATLGYIRRYPTRWPQATVSRLRFDRGWRLDRDVQFFADGATGLRAYRLYAFEGDKRLIWNLEHRVFSGRELLQIVSPGIAVFFDTGTAASTGRPLRLSDLKSDVGIGLRLGISRASSNNVLRVDLAYAFNHDPAGRRGLLVSFSSGQAF